MTVNEIITALWCCAESTCYKCPLENHNDDSGDERFCYEKIMIDAVETIKSLQAENERLKENIDGLNIFSGNYLKLFKTAVIKEVLLTLETAIEESNKYIREYEDSKEQRAYNKGLKNAYILVKEMTESVNYESSKKEE